MGENSPRQSPIKEECEESTSVALPPLPAADQRKLMNPTGRNRCESTNSDVPETLSAKDYLKQREKFYEDDDFVCPLALLPGETELYQGKALYGQVVLLTTFRLIILRQNSISVIPMRLIESLESINVAGLSVLCKDGTSHSFHLANTDSSFKWHGRIKLELAPSESYTDFFTWPFSVSLQDENQPWQELSCFSKKAYSLESEIRRLGFRGSWRVSNINEKFGCCATYPEENLVPSSFTDETLQSAAKFRALCRFPSAVWRSKDTGMVLLRSSQPSVGLFCTRSEEDENLMQSIMEACHSESMLIIDARSYTSAIANRAKGGGCEYKEYYANCDIQYMNLPNIHSIRASMMAVRSLVSSNTPNASWYSSLDATKWMLNLSLLLEATQMVANALSRKPVLVHCSDGWDRTPQIVSLTQLVLDPYYRTLKGFQILVEKEWLLFGHKFADRCGHSLTESDPNEISPVFVQWLDAVYQLTLQYPTAFEFNDTYLLKLRQHVYSCLFGTFLFNNEQEQRAEPLSREMASVWSYLDLCSSQLANKLYTPTTPKVLTVSSHLRDLKFWSQAFTSSNDALCDQVAEPNLQRSHSHSDISAAIELPDQQPAKAQRRVSDPDLISSLGTSDSVHSIVGGATPAPQSFDSSAATSAPSADLTSLEIISMTEAAEKSKDTAQHRESVDLDGLVLPTNPVQQKVSEIVADYQRQIKELQKRVLELETRPVTYHNIPSPIAPEADHVPSSAGSSTSGSDHSWEELSHHDVQITLWMPDHTATACSGCNTQFQLLKRKHHCRQCGQVFCNSCASAFVPIPEQQLFEPVRVCETCHEKLINSTASHRQTSNEKPEQQQQSTSYETANSSSPPTDPLHCAKYPMTSTPVNTSSGSEAALMQSIAKSGSSPKDREAISSQPSLQGGGNLLSGRTQQKTCSQESINVESMTEGSHLIGARAEC